MDDQRTDKDNAAKGRDDPTDLAEMEQAENFQRFAQPLPPRVQKPLPVKSITAEGQHPHKETRRERKTFQIDQGQGTLEISAAVIAAIVREEGPRVDGVVEIIGRTLRNKLRKLFWSGRIADGVYVEKNDNLLHMEVTLAVRYGVNIPSLAEQVRARLAEKIELITGYRVVTINVVVDRIVVMPETKQGESQ